MRRMIKKILTLGLLAAISAQAHPGHLPLEQGAAHFVSSPYHLATGLAIAVGLWATSHFAKTAGQKHVLRGASIVAALAAALTSI
jgi:hypothetical protein